jgi:hypothetical protein
MGKSVSVGIVGDNGTTMAMVTSSANDSTATVDTTYRETLLARLTPIKNQI